MGLLDVLNGMQNGPRGGSSRMSPITMALLGLLAYKAVKGMSGSTAPAAGPVGSAAPREGGGFGGLLDQLGGLFGGSAAAPGNAPATGPTGKGVAGALLNGGLFDLLKQFRGAGQANAADSWVATGPNQAISPTDLSRVLTPEQMEFLSQRTGLSREQLLAGLSESLPQAVDELTPDGRIPAPEELQRRLR